jgi:DNA-binding winged helix-turn-helix (wHTH) protein/Tol biopolymer transport system component
MERALSQHIYRFGPFELSVDPAELRKNGIHLKLQDQPFRILCALLEHPGELVTREQLRFQLWPEGTFVDFEHGLNTAIKKIRDVLSDDADTPRYIETISRKGYWFVAPVSQDDAQPIRRADSPSSRHYWRWRAALLLVALVIVIGVALLVVRSVSHPPHLRISQTTQLTFTGALSPRFAIETDGRRVYYFKYADAHLYSVPVGGGTENSYATRLVDPLILHISPDGSTLLVKQGLVPSFSAPVTSGDHDRLWLLPTNGGPARPLGDIVANAAAWSPDGKTIAFAKHNAIWLTEDEGATHRRLADAPDSVTWIRWSPDAQRLRFSVLDSKTRVSSIWEVGRDGKRGPAALKLAGLTNTCCGVWTRDGQYFLFRVLHDERSDYWSVRENGLPFQFRKPVLFSGGSMAIMAAIASPLENRLFVITYESSGMAFKFDLAHRQLTPFLPEFSPNDPAFSPDGKNMVFIQWHGWESILWRARSDGSELLQLTDPKLFLMHARFSSDGKRIIMMAKWPDQPWKIYWVSAEGGALHEINVPITSQADPNWIPDNQSILFGQPPPYIAEPDTSRAIYIYNLESNSISKVTGSEGWFSPRLSPDGRSFLALSIDQHKLAVCDLSTSQWRVLLEGHQFISVPFWSSDGKWAYATLGGGKAYVSRVRIHGGITEQVFFISEKIPSPNCWAREFAPDGSLMISCDRLNSNIYALQYD